MSSDMNNTRRTGIFYLQIYCWYNVRAELIRVRYRTYAFPAAVTVYVMCVFRFSSYIAAYGVFPAVERLSSIGIIIFFITMAFTAETSHISYYLKGNRKGFHYYMLIIIAIYFATYIFFKARVSFFLSLSLSLAHPVYIFTRASSSPHCC